MGRRYRYAVLGAGRQGTAAAYDLSVHGDADEVVLLDADRERAERAARRVNGLGGRPVARAEQLDVRDAERLEGALRGFDAALSAVPYRFNVAIAEAAIRAGVPLCDLGGATDVVLEQLKLDESAKGAGVAIVPDCGLAPGTANVLAVYAMRRLEREGLRPEGVKIYCGGLPRRPRGPLDYQLVFSVEGLLNEYLSPAHVLRDGRVQTVEALTEVEELELPGVGRCEAFITSGGTSTAPWEHQTKLKSYEYKTVRYPGHCEKIKLLRDLGLLEGKARAVVAQALERKLDFGEPDLVVLQVVCSGSDGEREGSVQLDLFDVQDEATGFTAMERTTGFSAAIVMHLLANGEIAPGVRTPDRAVDPEVYVNELLKRGFRLAETVRRPLALRREPESQSEPKSKP